MSNMSLYEQLILTEKAKYTSWKGKIHKFLEVGEKFEYNCFIIFYFLKKGIVVGTVPMFNKYNVGTLVVYSLIC